MKKSEVIKYFNGVNATARALRIRPAAVSKWPDELTDRIAFRVEIVTGGLLKTNETLRFEADRARHVSK